MAEFEPVLTRNWSKPDAATLAVAEANGAYRAARKGHDPRAALFQGGT